MALLFTMDLTGKIKYAIAKSDLNVKTLADKTGFTTAYIYMIMRNQRKPTIEFLKRIIPVLKEAGADPQITLKDVFDNSFDL